MAGHDHDHTLDTLTYRPSQVPINGTSRLEWPEPWGSRVLGWEHSKVSRIESVWQRLGCLRWRIRRNTRLLLRCRALLEYRLQVHTFQRWGPREGREDDRKWHPCLVCSVTSPSLPPYLPSNYDYFHWRSPWCGCLSCSGGGNGDLQTHGSCVHKGSPFLEGTHSGKQARRRNVGPWYGLLETWLLFWFSYN